MSGAWNNLTMREKAGFIKIGVDNGLTSLSDIQSAYNKFAKGGRLYDEGGQEKKYATTQGYQIRGTEFVDNDALEVDQYGNVLNPYTGGWGSVILPTVTVTPANSERPTADMKAYIEALRRTNTAYGNPSNWTGGQVGIGTFINDKPLRSVSPEFDLITMGSVGKDLFKFGKNLLSLRKMPVSYTGVPNKKVPTFMDYNPEEHFGDPLPKETGAERITYIYASSDPQTAFGHLHRDLGNGKIFKLYNKEAPGEIHIKSPQEEFGVTDPDVSYYYGNMPFGIEEGKLVKLPLDQRSLEEGYAAFQEGYENYLYGPSTEDLLQLLRPKGYNKIRVDGLKLGYDPNPRITEYIYTTDKNIIKAPFEEPLWKTALRTNNIDPYPVVANGALGAGNILYDHTKALGGHIYDGETEDTQQMDTPLSDYQYYGNAPSVLEQLAELEFYKKHGYVPDLEESGYRNANQNYAVPSYPHYEGVNEDLGLNIQNMPVEEANRLAQQGYNVTSWLPEIPVIGSLSRVKNLDLSDPNNPRMLTPFDQNYILPEYSQTWIDENIPYYLAKQFDRRENPEYPLSRLRLSEEELQRYYPNATRADLLREDAKMQENAARGAQLAIDLAALAITPEMVAPEFLKGVGTGISKVARGAIDWSYPVDRLAMKFGAKTFGTDVVTGLPKTVMGANTLAGALTNAGTLGYFGAEGIQNLYNFDWGNIPNYIQQNWNNPEAYASALGTSLSLLPLLGPAAMGMEKVGTGINRGATAIKDYFDVIRRNRILERLYDFSKFVLGSSVVPLMIPANLITRSKWFTRPGGWYNRIATKAEKASTEALEHVRDIRSNLPTYTDAVGIIEKDVSEKVATWDSSSNVSRNEMALDVLKKQGYRNILDTDTVVIKPDGSIRVTRAGNPFELEKGEGESITLQEFGTDKYHTFILTPGNTTQTVDKMFSRKEAEIPEELVQLLKHNSDYIKSLFPEEMRGEIFDFGSTILTQQKLFGKVPHDVDFLITEEAANSLPELKNAAFNGNGFTKTIKVPIDEQGHTAEVDFNVIDTDADGNITGQLADELIRQFFPNRQSAKLMNEARQLLGIPTQEVPKVSLDELLQRYDPVKKSIMDSLEVNFLYSGKEKHRTRIFKMINSDGPQDVLREGIRGFGQTILGENCTFAPELDWSNVGANREFLKKIKLPLDFADNPEKMQTLFELWYLDQTTMYRKIDSATLKSIIKNPTEKNLIDAFNVWIAQGGNAWGLGLNGTLSAQSGHHGDIAAFKQLPIDLSGTSSPLEAFEKMEKALGRSYAVTAEDLAEMPTVAKYLKVGDTLDSLLPKAPRNDTQLGETLFDELYNRLGTVALHNKFNSGYGSGKYISVRNNTARGMEHFTDQMYTNAKNATQSLDARVKSFEIYSGVPKSYPLKDRNDVWADPSPAKIDFYARNKYDLSLEEGIQQLPKSMWKEAIVNIANAAHSNMSNSEIREALKHPELLEHQTDEVKNWFADGLSTTLIKAEEKSSAALSKARFQRDLLDVKSAFFDTNPYYISSNQVLKQAVKMTLKEAAILAAGVLAIMGFRVIGKGIHNYYDTSSAEIHFEHHTKDDEELGIKGAPSLESKKKQKEVLETIEQMASRFNSYVSPHTNQNK